MQRTLRFKLSPTPEQTAVLLDTLKQHEDCFNVVAEQGWNEGEKNGVELHKVTYYPLREKHPSLPAQLVIAARVRATEAVKSALTRKRQGKQVSCPRSNLPPIRYDQRSYTPHLRAGTVSLATVAGRQILPIILYPWAIEKLQQATDFDSADLIYRHGRFLLHVVVTLPDANTLPKGKMVGIDFGITRPAVTSDNFFFGERRWKNTEHRYFRLKRKLQAKGTRSAKKHLRKLAGKVYRFRSNCDHIVSRRIIQSVASGTTLVVENLTEIRQRTKQNGRIQRRAMHQWPYRRLRALLDYKAEAHGCIVVGIDPRHTSQQCSRCGYIHRSNRRSQSRFVCRACGYELNADLNGARCIAAKYLAGDGKSVTGGLPVNQSIVTIPSVSVTSPRLQVWGC